MGQTCPPVFAAASAHWLQVWPISVHHQLPFSFLGIYLERPSSQHFCIVSRDSSGCQLRVDTGNSVWSEWLQGTNLAPSKHFRLASQACQRRLELPHSPCGYELYTLITHSRGEIGVTGRVTKLKLSGTRLRWLHVSSSSEPTSLTSGNSYVAPDLPVWVDTSLTIT